VTGPGRPGIPRPPASHRPGPRGRPATAAGGADRARPVPAAGPLSRVIVSDSTAIRPTAGYPLAGSAFGAGANALVIMHRVAFYSERTGKLDETGQRNLLSWASGSHLGQDAAMVAAVAARRAQAVERLRAQGQRVVRLVAVPEWRLAVGLGNKANPHEIGLSLHGTYGWPVIPGSALKGLAAAWASATVGDPAEATSAGPADVRRVFGTPRPRPAPEPQAEGSRPRRDEAGTVSFLDAIPAGAPVKVCVDVLTPHVKDYYETTRPDSARAAEPPAEYHNPVPVSFLTVSGAFAVDVYGRAAADVDLAAAWLIEAGDEFGAGAKTAAGYGFLSVTSPSGSEG
jgi:CRISPR type III-B/RAMP module RAMP protein Cmr6